MFFILEKLSFVNLQIYFSLFLLSHIHTHTHKAVKEDLKFFEMRFDLRLTLNWNIDTLSPVFNCMDKIFLYDYLSTSESQHIFKWC